MTKKLHELIEMAKAGQCFIAKTSFSVPLKEKHFLQKEPWSESFITADWTVRIKREPRVVWVSEFLTGTLQGEAWSNEEDAAFHGKPIKFIEVIENEKNICVLPSKCR